MLESLAYIHSWYSKNYIFFWLLIFALMLGFVGANFCRIGVEFGWWTIDHCYLEAF